MWPRLSFPVLAELLLARAGLSPWGTQPVRRPAWRGSSVDTSRKPSQDSTSYSTIPGSTPAGPASPGRPVQTMESLMADLPALFDLSGRTAVVTGGGGALGSVVAEGLAAAGARVAVVDLRAENAERVSRTIAEAGGQAIGLRADLSSEADVERVFEAVDGSFSRIDVLVTAASAPVDRYPAAELPLA